MKENKDTSFQELIPLSDITPEARKIAVAWIENYQPMGFDIQQKHKLASDIMNYAASQTAAFRQSIAELTACVEHLKECYSVKQMPLNHYEWSRIQVAIERAKQLIK